MSFEQISTDDRPEDVLATSIATQAIIAEAVIAGLPPAGIAPNRPRIIDFDSAAPIILQSPEARAAIGAASMSPEVVEVQDVTTVAAGPQLRVVA